MDYINSHPELKAKVNQSHDTYNTNSEFKK